jgi:hypothetical protein
MLVVLLRRRLHHAVIRRPATGDFRVQEELGGSFAKAQPSEALVELELIEPSLFFGGDRLAAVTACE